jgi:hypothetical protein
LFLKDKGQRQLERRVRQDQSSHPSEDSEPFDGGRLPTCRLQLGSNPILDIGSCLVKRSRKSGYFCDGILIPSYLAAFTARIKRCFPEIVFIVLGANQDLWMLFMTFSKKKG